MKPAPRKTTPPRVVALGSTVASGVCGLVLVAVGPYVPVAMPQGLVPATVVDHVLRLLPHDARDARFNGLYGSGHSGAWQFAAHLTWRTPDGQLEGGRVFLPETAGQEPMETTLDTERLEREERIGWPPVDLGRVLRRLDDMDAPLALIEFVPDEDARPAPVVSCAGQRHGPGSCIGYDRSATAELSFTDELFELPLGAAVSVQRRTAPVEAP